MLFWLFLDEAAGHFCFIEIGTKQLWQSRILAFVAGGAKAENRRILAEAGRGAPNDREGSVVGKVCLV